MYRNSYSGENTFGAWTANATDTRRSHDYTPIQPSTFSLCPPDFLTLHPGVEWRPRVLCFL